MAVKPYDPNDPTADPYDPMSARNALTDQMGPSNPLAPVSSPTKTTNTAPTAGTAPGPTPAPQFFDNAGNPGTNAPAPGQLMPTPNVAGSFAPNSPNDPNPSDPYMQLQAFLQGHAGDPQAGINAWMGASGKSTPGAQWYPDTQTIGLANGTYLVAPGAGGNSSKTNWQVVQRGPEGGGAIDTSGLGATTDPLAGNIRDILTSQMQGDLGPVDANNPNIAPEIGAFDTQSQRDEQTTRDRLAEEYYASGSGGGAGLDSGSFNTARQQARETSAGQRANFTGSAVFQEAQARRSQLSDLLKTATTYGLTTQAQQLQAQIAAIDAKLREQGLTQQNSQFGDSLGFSYANLQAQLNRDALTAGLNG